jgi:hypothetical protein
VTSPPSPPAQPIYERTSRTLHLIITVISFGGWAIFVSRKRKQYQQDWARYEQARASWEAQFVTQYHLAPQHRPGHVPTT